MRVLVAMLAVLFAGACRLHFEEQTIDASTDGGIDVAALGHDEDGDGLPDTIDPCPHVTSKTWHGYGGWIGELYDIMGPTSGYSGAPTIRFAINGLDIELTYLAVIDTI